MWFRAFTQFVPLPFSRDDGDVPFRDAIHHKYSIKVPKERVILLRIGWKTGWWRFRFDSNKSFFLKYELGKLKNVEFAKMLSLTCCNLIKFWPRIKNHNQSRVLIESNPMALFLSSTKFTLETPRGIPPVPSRMVKLQVPARVRLSHRKSFVGRYRKKFRNKWSYAIIIARGSVCL